MKQITVGFALTLDYTTYVDELALSTAVEELIGLFAAGSALEGMLVISSGEGTELRIIDELEPWVQNLCFDAVTRICAGESVTVRYYSRAGYLTLNPQDNQIHLSGDLTPAATFPRAELLKELFDCGCRFIDFAGSLKGSDEDYMANLDYVREFRQPARNALAHAGVID